VSVRGFGRVEVAKEVGISESTLYSLGHEGRLCRLDVAEKLAELLGTTVDDLRQPPEEPVIRQWHLYLTLHNLNSIRKAQGLTWSEVAAKTELSESSLKHYGAKAHRCLPQMAQHIADALGVSLEELKGEE
jgi:DNA-binding XRE family transcriptional regulator